MFFYDGSFHVQSIRTVVQVCMYRTKQEVHKAATIHEKDRWLEVGLSVGSSFVKLYKLSDREPHKLTLERCGGRGFQKPFKRLTSTSEEAYWQPSTLLVLVF